MIELRKHAQCAFIFNTNNYWPFFTSLTFPNMMFVKTILQQKGSQIWTISPDATILEALQVLADKNIGALPVVEHDKLVGIFSERDYARKVVLKGKSSKDTLVRELMTAKVYFVKPARSMEDCMRLMSEKHIRHLPVMEKGKLVGIITIGDVVNAIISQQKRMIRDLEGYVSGAMYIS